MSNSFQESVEYLLSLGNEVLAMKLGLENVRKLLRALGDPQTQYLKVQVAGTNGKGSVCAFLNSICVAAGIRVGMFTSPHLISITERVKIDGREIKEDEFARIATQVRLTSEKLAASGELENVPTFFEQVTAIALLAFADAKVELAILETGLGGRLDATTAANRRDRRDHADRPRSSELSRRNDRTDRGGEGSDNPRGVRSSRR
jgi:dihydrofolate synthase/folylpolyglutamate synthase